jgi:hypothetical protein
MKMKVPRLEDRYLIVIHVHATSVHPSQQPATMLLNQAPALWLAK